MAVRKIIQGERIYLRILKVADATEEYKNWLSDPKVNAYLETRDVSRDDLKKYIKEKELSKNCEFFGIFLNGTKEHIGNIKLEPIDLIKKKAELGIIIGNKKFWGKGFGTEATKLVIDYAFNTLNLSELELGVIPEHKVAYNLYKKLGFCVSRIEKNASVISNHAYDWIIMKLKKL